MKLNNFAIGSAGIDSPDDISRMVNKTVSKKLTSNKSPTSCKGLPADVIGPLPLNWPIKYQSSTQKDGEQYHGPCPLCEQKTDGGGKDRLQVWPKHHTEEGGTKWKWRCSQCDSSGGDAIDFIRKYYGVDFPTAEAMITEASEAVQVDDKWEPPDKDALDAGGNAVVRYYDADKPVSHNHQYLARKGVNVCNGMYSFQTDKMIGGKKFKAGDIAVPVIHWDGTDEIIGGLQVINANGDKAFVKDTVMKGGYFRIPCKERLENDRLLIVEGLANGLTVNQVTGYETLVAFDAGNLLNVAIMAKHRRPDRDIVLCCDNDIGDGKNNLGMASAVKAAGAISGFLAIPEWNGKKCDFNDVLTQSDDIGKNQAVICNAIEHARRVNFITDSSKSQYHSKESDDAEIERLAVLADNDSLEYGRAKKESAKRLGVPVPELDKLVSSRKEYNTLFKRYDIPPCPETADGVQLIHDIYAVIDRFIVCSKETKIAATMWIVMTWFADVIDCAPIALITSPEKRCGKSMLLTIMQKLVYMPLQSSGISSSAIYRTIEKYHPTLLIDEADTFMKDNEGLRGVINSGIKRDGAFVIRSVGDNHDTKAFNTFGPKAIAGIGTLKDTIMDRSIILELRRKSEGDTVERLRDAGQEMWDTLRSRLARFTTDNKDVVKNAKPPLPGELNDREQDCWEPLLQIATVIDACDTDRDNGTFYDDVVRTSIIISKNANKGEESPQTQLLRSIRELFDSLNVKRMPTKALNRKLCENETWPWRHYNNGGSINDNQIAALLRKYGIKPCPQFRLNDAEREAFPYLAKEKNPVRGYKRDDFTDAFKRYL